MKLSSILVQVLRDNGFSSPEELIAYRDYDSGRLGCNEEERFIIRSGDANVAHKECELLDLLMEVAHGALGKKWDLLLHRVKEKWETEPDGTTECPYYIDELTIRLPGRPDEKYFFDVTAWYLSIDRFLPGGEFYEDAPETNVGGFRESKD